MLTSTLVTKKAYSTRAFLSRNISRKLHTPCLLDLHCTAEYAKGRMQDLFWGGAEFEKLEVMGVRYPLKSHHFFAVMVYVGVCMVTGIVWWYV